MHFILFDFVLFWKSQKKTQENINNKLALVMKSGKYTLGYKTVLKSLRSSKGLLYIFFILRATDLFSSCIFGVFVVCDYRIKFWEILDDGRKIDSDFEQLSAAPEIGDRVLCDAFQSQRAPFSWE